MLAVPLDAAAYEGHLEVARELIRVHGIEGCGGASGGVQALRVAARAQQVVMMEVLTSAGVIDNGLALQAAVRWGRESSVKFLLLQWKRNTSGAGANQLETSDSSGVTIVVRAFGACHHSCSPRICRMLVDAGADRRRPLY